LTRKRSESVADALAAEALDLGASGWFRGRRVALEILPNGFA